MGGPAKIDPALFTHGVIGIRERQGQRIAKYRLSLLKSDSMIPGIRLRFVGVPLKVRAALTVFCHLFPSRVNFTKPRTVAAAVDLGWDSGLGKAHICRALGICHCSRSIGTVPVRNFKRPFPPRHREPAPQAAGRLTRRAGLVRGERPQGLLLPGDRMAS